MDIEKYLFSKEIMRIPIGICLALFVGQAGLTQRIPVAYRDAYRPEKTDIEARPCMCGDYGYTTSGGILLIGFTLKKTDDF